MIKSMYRIGLMLLMVLFLTSCNFTDFLTSPELNTNPTDASPDQGSDDLDVSGNSGDVGLESVDKAQPGIEMVVLGEGSEKFSEDSIPAGAISNPSPDAFWSIKLFFADRDLVVEDKPGPYGFVTPAVREMPVTSGILKCTLDELIKGPLSGEKNLGSVLPPSVKINKLSIQDKVAAIDFNEALLTDHPGGTLGGSITIQALVFTASQFDSIDAVLVTVKGEPWNDGHFVWDTPIYEKDLLNNIQ